MKVFPRRAALSALGTVAAATVWRKPALAAPEYGVIVPRDPPASPPAVSFMAADSGMHSLAEFAGKGVVLNCWATWCVPCVKEMPALAGLAGLLGSAGIVVLALSSDRGGAPAVERFYHDHAISGLDIWLDPHGDATRALGLRGIPTTLILDRAGREQARAEGAIDWTAPDIVARVRQLAAVA